MLVTGSVVGSAGILLEIVVCRSRNKWKLREATSRPYHFSVGEGRCGYGKIITIIIIITIMTMARGDERRIVFEYIRLSSPHSPLKSAPTHVDLRISIYKLRIVDIR